MSKIKVLEEIDHIRKRPGMYIGEGDTPIHLVTEVLDNALDELVNRYTKKISVNIDDDTKHISISDWGRGIPIHKVDLPDGSKVDSVIAIATKLFSSAKFDRESYDISIGQNGVGLVVVNALSEYMTITTKHPNKKNYRLVYSFKNGTFKSKKEIKVDNNYPSTTVEFKPDMKYFKTWFDKNEILDRLKLVKIHYPTYTIIFNNSALETIDYEWFIRQILQVSNEYPLYTLKVKNGKEEAILSFTYDMSDNAKLQPIVKGDVNLKIADGSYISTIQSTIANAVDSIKPKNYIMTKQDSLIRLRAYISILVPEPRFDSQNKTRFVGDVRQLIKKFEPEIKKLYRKEKFLQEVLEKLNEYRILKSMKSSTNKSKKQKRTSAGNPVKMSRKKGILYIVEGLSAAGTLTQIRNINNESVFPLKGKIVNVESNTLDKILNNNEVKYLLEVLNIEPGKDYDTEWDKIVIMPDADADGNHIGFLSMLLLFRFARKYFDEGKVYLIIPPLYAYKQNGRLVLHPGSKPPPVKNFIRYKGLGEMNPEELKLVIDDKRFWIRVLPEGSDIAINIIKDTNAKRKLLIDSTIVEPFQLVEA